MSSRTTPLVFTLCCEISIAEVRLCFNLIQKCYFAIALPFRNEKNKLRILWGAFTGLKDCYGLLRCAFVVMLFVPTSASLLAQVVLISSMKPVSSSISIGEAFRSILFNFGSVSGLVIYFNALEKINTAVTPQFNRQISKSNHSLKRTNHLRYCDTRLLPITRIFQRKEAWYLFQRKWKNRRNVCSQIVSVFLRANTHPISFGSRLLNARKYVNPSAFKCRKRVHFRTLKTVNHPANSSGLQ